MSYYPFPLRGSGPKGRRKHAMATRARRCTRSQPYTIGEDGYPDPQTPFECRNHGGCPHLGECVLYEWGKYRWLKKLTREIRSLLPADKPLDDTGGLPDGPPASAEEALLDAAARASVNIAALVQP